MEILWKGTVPRAIRKYTETLRSVFCTVTCLRVKIHTVQICDTTEKQTLKKYLEKIDFHHKMSL